MSCAPTEPVDTHDDNAILQLLLNMADSSSLGFLKNTFDIDGNGILYCMELPNTLADTVTCDMENGRFTKIKLSNMGLSGPIPQSIGDLTELTHLGLKNNNLTGEMPESIGNLTNLTQLNLADNAISGIIPDTIGNLISLRHLVLSNNGFSGSIPNSIGDLSALHTFLADSNNLSGTISSDICILYQNFIDYNLAGNNFCQSLPTCLDTPEKIGYQNCDTSCSTGYVHNNGYCYSQTDLSVLDSLIINQNSLNMKMDADSSQMIEPLELGTQEWSAGRLEKLDCHWVDTASCNLSITIPENIIELDSLKYLNLQENSLSGKLPDGFGNLSALEYLNLQDNNLTGSVPETIGDLPELSTLKLQNNKIGCYEFDSAEDICRVHCNDDDIDICSGYVAENICKIEPIENVDLSNNMLCPCYPECLTEEFSNFENLQDTEDCSYCNEGYERVCYGLPESVIIQEGDSLCFKTDNLAVLDTFIINSLETLPDSLDLSMDVDSSNTIQPLELGIQYWGNGQLIYFNASGRGLSGGIPESIDNLDSLRFLIISNNYLSGELPVSIYTLLGLDYQLDYLNLSGNQLTGYISPIFCAQIDNWEMEGNSQNNSYLYNNNFCPPYTECILPYVGVQNTTECPMEE